jgi:hypothetical protein
MSTIDTLEPTNRLRRHKLGKGYLGKVPKEDQSSCILLKRIPRTLHLKFRSSCIETGEPMVIAFIRFMKAYVKAVESKGEPGNVHREVEPQRVFPEKPPKKKRKIKKLGKKVKVEREPIVDDEE